MCPAHWRAARPVATGRRIGDGLNVDDHRRQACRSQGQDHRSTHDGIADYQLADNQLADCCAVRGTHEGLLDPTGMYREVHCQRHGVLSAAAGWCRCVVCEQKDFPGCLQSSTPSSIPTTVSSTFPSTVRARSRASRRRLVPRQAPLLIPLHRRQLHQRATLNDTCNIFVALTQRAVATSKCR